MNFTKAGNATAHSPPQGKFPPLHYILTTFMHLARLHDDELDTTSMKTPCQQHVQARARSLLTGLRRPVILLISALGLPQVSATPIELNGRDGGGGSSSGMNTKIFIPIVIFCAISFVLVILSTKASLRRAISGFSLTGAAPSVGLGRPAGARVVTVTAEQLAGTINGEGARTNVSAPQTTRRPRRPRRTPSQMSVTSLPAYHKEPGEEELVIFRGQDMEDATMPAAVVRHSADESSLSLDHSNVSRYSPMPTSPHTMPLLNPDDAFEGDLSTQSLQLHANEGAQTFHETSSLMRTESNDSHPDPDPRGEAPPYFEVVDRGDSQDTERTHVSPTTSPEPTQGSINRRSGFRSFLNRMSMASQPNGHNRNDSNNSVFSSNAGRESTSRASHRRNNHSGSGSVLSSSMFRTISRQRSNNTLASPHLTSPSMISLNSISSPLTHTVTRTEFTYPKTGLTAEQLKVISSREAFARFGVPYGADAIAFASSSRLDLLQPPPDFETAASASQLHLPLSGSSTSPPNEVTPDSGSAPRSNEPAVSETNAQPNLSPSSPPPTTSNDNNETSASPLGSSSISKKHDSLSVRTSVVAGTTSLQTASTGPSASERRSVSEFGSLSPSMPHDNRFESRASVRSNQSYATAVETLGASTRSRQPSELADLGDGGSEYASGRSTPVVGAHATQPSEATAATPSRPGETPLGGAT